MPAGANGRAHLSIGEVLSLLQEEFPDVTISKIRFLESQGLLDPERTPSGYRKFYDYDIERLRWILRLQKDHYLPLKVIKDRLDEGGAVPPSTNGAGVLPFPGIGAGADGAADGRGVSVGGPGSTDETEEIVGSAGTEGEAGAAAPGGRRGAPGPARTARDGRPREGRRASRVARSTASRSAATAGRARDGSPSASSTPPASLGARSADGTGTGRGTGSGRAGAAPANDGAAIPSPSSSPSPRAAADRTPPGGGGPRRPTGGRGASGGTPPSSRGGSGSAPGAYGADRTAQAPGASTPADPSARMNGHTAYDPGPDAVSLTVDELAEASGLSLRDIRDLERFGLIEPRDGVGGSAYDGDALIVARTAAGFLQHGIEARHMRTYKVAVDREAGLFQQIVSPVLKQRNPEARTRAARTITELIRLGEVMRGVLLRRELRDHTGGS